METTEKTESADSASPEEKTVVFSENPFSDRPDPFEQDLGDHELDDYDSENQVPELEDLRMPKRQVPV
jgi:hypothetical protein